MNQVEFPHPTRTHPHLILHIGAGQTRHGHINDIFFQVVTTCFQKRRHFGFNFIIPGLVPVHRRIIHFVDGHNQCGHTQRLGQPEVPIVERACGSEGMECVSVRTQCGKSGS